MREFNETFVATEDLSTFKYTVIVNSSNGCAREITAGAKCHGILQNKPLSGGHATVTTQGRSKFLAGGTIVAGNPLAVTISATLIHATSGDYVLADAITSVASGSNGDCEVTHAGYKAL